MKHEHTTTRPTKVKVFRYTTEQQAESVEVSTESTNGETDCLNRQVNNEQINSEVLKANQSSKD